MAIAAENTGHHRVETGYYQRVMDLDVYYGVLPAEVAGKHLANHEERTMHGGAPTSRNEYHLVVALFNTNGKRITDANVTATVGEFGMAGTRKTLEPMRIDNTTTFGNYFVLHAGRIYRIAIEVRRLGKQKAETIEALFDYRFQ
jgi:hypothetical protein